MRVFKQLREQAGSHSKSPQDTPGGQSPAGGSAYYQQRQERPKAQYDGADDQAAVNSNSPAYEYARQSRPAQGSYPANTVVTEHAQPAVNTSSAPLQTGHPQATSNAAQYPQGQSIEDKDGKKSRRSYFGIQPSVREPTPKNLGRSVSVRRRQPPQPTLDTTQPIPRYPQQPHSAIEPSQSAQQGVPTGRETVRHIPSPSQASQENVQENTTLIDQNRSQGSLIQSRESIQGGSPAVAESISPTPTGYESVTTSQNPYAAYQSPKTPKSADRDSLQAREAYRVRPTSRQSLGPPSPLTGGSPIRAGGPHTDQAGQPPSPPYAQSQDIMAREGQVPASRSSTQLPQNYGHDQGQYVQGSGSNLSAQRANGPQKLSENIDSGRSTPPLASRSREDVSGSDLATLSQKYDELQAKYSKVKRYYYDRDAQVHQLQNIVAHQRLSMNNTSLDDSEYQSRFNRLDGAINNLAFNIRKDWKAVPPWLQAVVDKDAAAVGTKEMTAVGRACISRWLMDEIFDRFFHPALEPGLSSQLKIVERNIRKNLFSKATSEDAQKDDHTVKLSNWRLTTMEGLQDILSTTQAQDYRSQLTTNLIEKLTAALQMNLKDPPPPGIEGGITGIVELAVGISVNIPLESRDIRIEYFMPGAPIIDTYMKVEMGLPPLMNPGASNDLIPSSYVDTDQASNKSAADSIADREEGGTIPPRTDSMPSASRDPRHEKKKSIFGTLVNKKPAPGEGPVGEARRGSIPGHSERDAMKEREATEKAAAIERERRIRFAAFVAVEVLSKGKEGGSNVLVKSPCYAYPERAVPQ